MIRLSPDEIPLPLQKTENSQFVWDLLFLKDFR
jgi:hypothetical protein